MSAPDVYYDGDYSVPDQVGPFRLWQDEFTHSRLYAQTVQQVDTEWSPLAIGAAGPIGGQLVQETEPHVVEGNIIEWERIFADVPGNFQRAEEFVYPVQLIITTTTGGATTQDLAEIPIATTAAANYSYIATTTPSTIAIAHAFRLVKIGTALYYIGTPFTPPVSNIQAQDTQVTLWRGNIYQVKNLILNVPTLVANSTH